MKPTCKRDSFTSEITKSVKSLSRVNSIFMLEAIFFGPNLTDKSNLELLKEARESGLRNFGSAPLLVKTAGVITASLPPGQQYQLVFSLPSGYAVQVGVIGKNALTQFPVYSEDGTIHLSTTVSAEGAGDKLIMPESSILLEYRVYLLSNVGAGKDPVLVFEGEKERSDLSLSDVVSGRISKFVESTAKMSTTWAFSGKISLILPSDSDELPVWKES